MKKLIFGILGFIAIVCQSQTETKEAKVDVEKSVIEKIMTRRSVRVYENKAVTRCDIDEVLKCGIHAPSAINKQPWEIRVVDDVKFISESRDIYLSLDSTRVKGVSHTFPNAPVYLFVARDKEFDWSYTDCGLLCGNICNAAWAKGLGTVIMGSTANVYKSTPELAEYMTKLGFSENYELLVVIALGYPNETPQVKPRDMSKLKYVEPQE